jgi:dTDP-4-amino-4,6-dideoxygalactose transaminase
LVFESEVLLLKAMEYLKSHEVFTRRYFYPSLPSSIPYVATVKLAITDDISNRVLCLPLYHDLSEEEVMMIGRLLLRVQNN